MKIASYNIMSGGFASYASASPEPERMEIIKEAVKKIDADFVALVDTYRWDKIFTSKKLEEIFGYKKSYTVNLDDERLKKLGHNNGITVLTDLDDVKFKTVRLFNRNAIEAKINFAGKKINIYSVYLDDLSEETRLKQITALLKISKNEINKIIMGDLNTIDKKDLSIISEKIDNFEEMKKAKTIALIKADGFKDVFKKYFPTVPSKLSPLKTKKPFLKLDYALYSKNIKVKNPKVLYDKIFDEASDHYPIVFEI